MAGQFHDGGGRVFAEVVNDYVNESAHEQRNPHHQNLIILVLVIRSKQKFCYLKNGFSAVTPPLATFCQETSTPQ